MDLATGVIAEMKRNPYTSLSALMCLGLTITGGPWMFVQKADAADVNALKDQLAAQSAQIAEVRQVVRRESAQGELNNVRRELFDITLRINTLERERINVDQLLYQRREALQAQQRDLEARLASMKSAQP